MNKWAMDGNTIEKWPNGGGRTACTGNLSHDSIHPFGRSDEYRYANRRRFHSRFSSNGGK